MHAHVHPQHGHHHQHHHQQPRVPTFKHYDALELKMGPTATEEDIRKAYKNMALKHHPDKGGDPEEFQRVRKAYEFLSNTGRRRLYDTLGDACDVAESGGGGGATGAGGGAEHSAQAGPFGFMFTKVNFPFTFATVFDAFADAAAPAAARAFAAAAARAQQQQHGRAGASQHHGLAGAGLGPRSPPATQMPDPDKTTDIIFRLKVTLQDLYKCETKKMRIKKTLPCYECRGVGGIQSQCSNCQGTGFMRSSVGFETYHAACEYCGRKGYVLEPVCDVCKGQKVIKISNVVSVELRPGQQVGVPIRIPGESLDLNLGPKETGLPGSSRLKQQQRVPDLIVYLEEMPDPLFKRVPSTWHLIMDKTITLGDALTGFGMRFVHLDGRPLYAHIKETVQSDQLYVIPGEGMLGRDGHTRGNLYIRFIVEHPQALSDDSKQRLRQILPVTPAVHPEQIAQIQSALCNPVDKNDFIHLHLGMHKSKDKDKASSDGTGSESGEDNEPHFEPTEDGGDEEPGTCTHQ